MNLPEIVICIIDNGAGKYLVIRRADEPVGRWESPAGHVDDTDSSLVSAVKRECQEEIGCIPLLRKTVRVKSITPDPETNEARRAILFSGSIPSDSEIVLNPEEHTDFKWLTLGECLKLEDVHPDWAEDLRFVDSMNKRSASRPEVVRVLDLPAPDVKEAILVGDEVEIFLRDQLEEATNGPKGIVRQIGSEMFEIQDAPENAATSVNWSSSKDWEIIRVKRSGTEIFYQVGNPYDEEANTEGNLALLVDPGSPTVNDSVFRTMRGETPDLDRAMSVLPDTFSDITDSPAHSAVLQNVRALIEEAHLEMPIIEEIGRDRLLILTEDPVVRREIKKVLKEKGHEVKMSRSRALVAYMSPMPNTPQMNRQPSVGGQPSLGGQPLQMQLPTQDDIAQGIADQTGGQVTNGPQGPAVELAPDKALEILSAARTAAKRVSALRKCRIAGVPVGLIPEALPLHPNVWKRLAQRCRSLHQEAEAVWFDRIASEMKG